LELLRALQLRGHARGLMLLSATPMQTHPWEPWDLLAVLGEGGRWLAEFGPVRDYYGTLTSIRVGTCTRAAANRAAKMVVNDEAFPPPPGAAHRLSDSEAAARRLLFVSPGERESLSGWLRRGSPLTRRLHRNTRETLRDYVKRGLLDQPPPQR